MGQRRLTRTVVVLVLVALLAGVLAAGAAVAWTVRRQGEHVATATVMLHPLEGNAYSPGGRGDDLVNLETEAQVLRSDAMARAVLDRLGERGEPSALLADVEVTVPPNTQLLQITAHGPDDRAAVARASAFAEGYLQFRRSRTESAVYERSARLEELVHQREDERNAALKRLDRLPQTAPERTLIEQQVQEVVVQISSLRTQLAAAQAISLDPGQVVSPGQPVARGPWADPVRAGSAAGGLAFAVVLAVAVVRTGRRLPRTVRGLEELTDITDAGPVPLGVLTTPIRAGGDVIARMRSVVLTVGSDRPPVVAIAVPGEGAAASFAPLVEALARARFEVVTVDLLRTADVVAMTELVLQEAVVDDVLVEDGAFRWRLRPSAGTGAGERTDFADLAASAEMRRSLADLAKRTDIVLVRSPGLTSPVGRALVAAVTAVVVELHPGRSTRAEIEDVVGEAERVGAQVVGIVEVEP